MRLLLQEATDKATTISSQQQSPQATISKRKRPNHLLERTT
jgi:hypothetical protein